MASQAGDSRWWWVAVNGSRGRCRRDEVELLGDRNQGPRPAGTRGPIRPRTDAQHGGAALPSRSKFTSCPWRSMRNTVPSNAPVRGRTRAGRHHRGWRRHGGGVVGIDHTWHCEVPLLHRLAQADVPQYRHPDRAEVRVCEGSHSSAVARRRERSTHRRHEVGPGAPPAPRKRRVVTARAWPSNVGPGGGARRRSRRSMKARYRRACRAFRSVGRERYDTGAERTNGTDVDEPVSPGGGREKVGACHRRTFAPRRAAETGGAGREAVGTAHRERHERPVAAAHIASHRSWSNVPSGERRPPRGRAMAGHRER